ncbi:MAG TPA: mannosyltransferase family protein [Ktedonobacteraceae bacterium]|nr:mannosyltransferase family protein [Ktedonobacteraceae bacterium]
MSYLSNLKTACKEAGWVFLLSRVIIVFVAYVGLAVLPQVKQQIAPECGHDICLFYYWDARAFVQVAHQAYNYSPYTAFFPLWPFLIHYGGRLLGGLYPLSYYLAGVILANICYYGVLVLLYLLLDNDFDASIARRTLFYLSFFPYALYFFAGYSESLFLLLCLGAFVGLQSGKALGWWIAGICGFFAALTRSAGIALAVPFLVVYIQRFWISSERNQHTWLQRINGFIPIALIPGGLLTYMVYLGITKGDPLIFSSVQSVYWHRQLALPWSGWTATISLMLTNSITSLVFEKLVVDAIFTIIPIAALVIGWRRIPLHYSLFALTLVLYTICFPITGTEPISSQPRFILTIFPIMVIFAQWAKRERVNQAYLAVCLPMLALNIIFFITHVWVA